MIIGLNENTLNHKKNRASKKEILKPFTICKLNLFNYLLYGHICKRTIKLLHCNPELYRGIKNYNQSNKTNNHANEPLEIDENSCREDVDKADAIS